MAAGGNARLFKYPEDCVEERDRAAFREKKLSHSKNTLFKHTNAGNVELMFYSKSFREWLHVIREQYPELQETQQDGRIIFESKKPKGTITLYLHAKVLVYGQEIMGRFEENFRQMKQTVRPGTGGTDGRARPFEYPKELEEEKKELNREQTLHDNEDTLYYDTRAGRKWNLIFYTKNVIAWLKEMNRVFPSQTRTQSSLISLKPHESGTISSYLSIKVVVEGQLVEEFEAEFPDMKQTALSTTLTDLEQALARLDIKN